jgi:hypothetical protein
MAQDLNEFLSDKIYDLPSAIEYFCWRHIVSTRNSAILKLFIAHVQAIIAAGN